MPLPRFRVRTLMIAVAVLAIFLGRSMHFRHLAITHHQELNKILVSDLEFYLAITRDHGDREQRHLRARVAAEPLNKFISYHQDMEEKYTNAFRHPWLPVLGDPPAPALPSEDYQKAFRTEFLPGIPIGPLHGQLAFPHPPEVATEAL